MRKIFMFVPIGVMLIGMSNNVSGSDPEEKPPNVVLICTDNQSPWSLGCYGNSEILTPNIDRLAKEGMLFEHSYSSNPVCSPARATLLTGLIPSQHGVHNYLIPSQAEHGVPDYLTKGIEIGPDAYNTIEEFLSLPEILSESGYVCGLSGKWHLGDNLNPHEGFSYWVSSPGGHTTTYYNAEVLENGVIRKEPMYLTDFWTDRGIRFMEENKEQPFFLLLTYNGPYGLHGFLDAQAKNRHGEYYATKEMNSFPREETHPWLRTNRESMNNITAMRRYAAEVSGVDDGVGMIMDALKRLGLDENTIVIFTADQGLCGGHHGMWGMSDHSRPLHTYDETIHTPMIWRHPEGIPENNQSELIVSNYDILPTILNYVGLGNKVSENQNLPGRDYSAVLQGEEIEWDNTVYYEFDNTRMIRTLEWKYTERFPQGSCIDELYDLKNDPSEKKNIIHVPEYENIKTDLQKKLHAFFDDYANPKYDLWQDGRSKSGTLIFKK